MRTRWKCSPGAPSSPRQQRQIDESHVVPITCQHYEFAIRVRRLWLQSKERWPSEILVSTINNPHYGTNDILLTYFMWEKLRRELDLTASAKCQTMTCITRDILYNFKQGQCFLLDRGAWQADVSGGSRRWSFHGDEEGNSAKGI